MSGVFITFEGGEGSGKSLQSILLAERLNSLGHEVTLTREPGGTHGAEEIRSLLLSGNPDRWDHVAESLLYLSARANHWKEIIAPSLASGRIVISDRFQDSSTVYQGICKGFDLDLMSAIYECITKNKYPDITYLIDIDPIIGLKRSLERKSNTETRFENMDISFHESVRQGFLNLAKQNPDRIKVIDGSFSEEAIHEIIFDNFKKKFSGS